MQHKEVSAVCSGGAKHVNKVYGENVEFCNIKPGGTQSSHWALNG